MAVCVCGVGWGVGRGVWGSGSPEVCKFFQILPIPKQESLKKQNAEYKLLCKIIAENAVYCCY